MRIIRARPVDAREPKYAASMSERPESHTHTCSTFLFMPPSAYGAPA